MMKVIVAVIVIWSMVLPAGASEIAAPKVPASGAERMPENTESFGDALLELLENSIQLIHPDLQEAAEVCAAIIFAAMVLSILPVLSQRMHATAEIAGAVMIATVIFQHTNSMILLAADTVRDIFEYGKLLCQAMTAALAAQGSVTTSTALYIGTTFFISCLGSMISKIIIPAICFFLAFAVANCALGDELLKRAADTIKGGLTWFLKTLLILFTTYMSITGVVSGTTDLAALKSAKVVISAAVPVVGGILADSSEAVLISIRLMKNAAGIYGMLAVLAVFIGPFLKIGVHYVMLRLSALLCSTFGNKRISVLAEHLSGAMSLLLATVAAGCVLVLISTVCFLKGAG